MDIIPGNHDTYYKNTNDLNSLKELLGHYMNEVTIHMDPTVIEYNGFKMALLPWINPENHDKSMEFVEKCKAEWLGGHLELVGFEQHKGSTAHKGMDVKPFLRFEKVLSGHYHTKSSRMNVEYLGSQMEFTWSDAHDPKFFHVLDTDTRELTPVRNPNILHIRFNYKDGEMEGFDFAQVDNKFVRIVVINRGEGSTFEEFIDRIEKRPIHDLKVLETFDAFVGKNVEEEEDMEWDETSILLDSYIEGVDTALDKKRLKSGMRELLIEAQSMEAV